LFWELQEHSYVCVSTLSSGAAADHVGISTTAVFNWKFHKEWYL